MEVHGLSFMLFNTVSTLIPIIVGVGFVFVFGMIIVQSIRGAKEWNQNNASPILSVSAIVVTKRTNVHHHHHSGGDTMHHASSSMTYYVTFQVESGDRMEFKVPGTTYGMLVEGDRGALTFQGTRYKGFEREIE